MWVVLEEYFEEIGNTEKNIGNFYLVCQSVTKWNQQDWATKVVVMIGELSQERVLTKFEKKLQGEMKNRLELLAQQPDKYQ